jgi:hypothetical protein
MLDQATLQPIAQCVKNKTYGLYLRRQIASASPGAAVAVKEDLERTQQLQVLSQH